MSKFDDFLNRLDDSIKQLAEKTFKDFINEAVKDSNDFLDKTKEDLKRWTEQLVREEISRDEFEWLVKGKKDLAEMNLLKEKGLALAMVDSFKTALIDTVIGTVFEVFL